MGRIWSFSVSKYGLPNCGQEYRLGVDGVPDAMPARESLPR